MAGSSTLEWPDHFPPSCPPSEAESQNHEVYRVVFNDPPQLVDFLSSTVRHPHPWPTQAEQCKACGISVWLNEMKATGLLRRFQGGMVAKGNISPDVGVSLKTCGRGHITWWILKNSEPNYQDFAVISVS